MAKMGISDILSYRSGTHQVKVLEDHSDLLSRLSQFLCWKIREDLSVYGDGSARRSLKQVDASHQCGFSGSGESDDTEDLTTPDMECDIRDRMDFFRTGIKRLCNMV